MSIQILTGDCIARMREIPDKSVQCAVTSPPYFGLRNYDVAGQIGLEETPQQYVEKMVAVFREVCRVLKDDGTLWLNLGDSYAGSGKGAWNAPEERKAAVKEVYRPNFRPATGTRMRADRLASNIAIDGVPAKNLIGIPWRVALALQADGWYLRAACPWIKRNGMPDSTKDRPTQCVETIFMLTKSAKCYYDSDAVKKAAKGGAKGSRFDTGKTAEHQLNRASSAPRIEDGTRLRRTSDWFFESWQGLLLDSDDEPSAFVVNLKGYKEAHFATFPPKLIEPCVLASSRPEDIILDPFGGSGTTAEVARNHGRSAILCELNPEYVTLAHKRLCLSLEDDLEPLPSDTIPTPSAELSTGAGV